MKSSPSEARIQRQISLPFKKAVEITLRSVRIRLGRSMITTAGIFLVIAFLVSVFTASVVAKSPEITKKFLQTRVDRSAAARQTWLIAMSLLVCAVGIANSMLMAVTERFKEIGTMKCLGALDGFIVELFLLESGMMGFIGSVSGAIAGFLVMYVIYSIKLKLNILGKIDIMLLLYYMGISVIIGTVLSILAAIYPAYRAARLPAAAALRTEI